MSRANSTDGRGSAATDARSSLFARIRSRLGAARRRLRAWRSRALHPSRRRRAREAIAALAEPRSVLFVCLGNVCRSPYAEARFRALTGDAIESSSVGFIGPGRPPPDEALRVAARRGLELETHRSRVVEEPDLRETDLVILMDPAHGKRLARSSTSTRPPVIPLGDLDPADDVCSRTIQDPWGRSPEVFEDVFSRIDRCLMELARSLGHPSEAGRRAAAEPRSQNGRT